MFVIKVDGKTAAVTNNYDSAVWYAEGLRHDHRITIRLLLQREMGAAMQSLEHSEATIR